MRLVPNWRTILLRSWSMIFTYLGVFITWGVAIAVYVFGDVPLSPFAVLILTALITPAMTIIGRIKDQGIGDA